mmetsp:Transcript_48375/g.151669  ORF Transcript_48375/g.151669 Transcript_48375/m.151669 type:complete len:437 (+) Transcript_48375:76-1386(+)
MPSGVRRSRYFGGYVSEEGANGLKAYKYAGSDKSLMLKYITNPMYNRIVVYFPVWLAPNLITLSGLLCTFVTYWIFHYYCPLLEGHAPWWAYMLNGFAILAYQALDAMDGKQARRTGSATALGVLFDHGCDALNATVMSVTMCAVVQYGPGVTSFVFWFVAVLVFYSATVEEYYTGELRLAIINGPNEGLAIAAGVNFITAAIGASFWTQQSPIFGITWNWILFIVTCGCAFFTITQNFFHVLLAVRENKAKVEGGYGKFRYRVALTRLLPFLCVVFLSLAWVLLSPTNIMLRHPRIVLWALGFLFSKLVTQLMLAHVCDEEYHPVGKTISVIAFLGAHMLFNLAHQVEIPALKYLIGTSILKPFNMSVFADRGMNILVPTPSNVENSVLVPHEDVVLYEFFIIAMISYVHFIIGVTREITEILGIQCFVIKPRRE